MLTKLFISLLLWLPLALFADQELAGRVVTITDGDTVRVLDARKTEHKVRLMGIDAPERVTRPSGRAPSSTSPSW